MPVIPSAYQLTRVLTGPHLQTIVPALFRNVADVFYQRQRIDTPDGDFLDLDWHRQGSKHLVVVLHGLEGNSDRAYVRGMVRAFARRGWDAVALNFRSCSGEMNRQPRFYHSGETGDLSFLLDHLRRTETYKALAVVGFSLGGNVTLKYLGELGADAPAELRAAVAISVPCDLAAASRQLSKGFARLYSRRFLRSLRGKVEAKAHQLPAGMQGRVASSLTEFDDLFTAPLHGFRDAADYYARSSSRQFLPAIRRPTLLLNALDDPFLDEPCFPYSEAEASEWLTLETPANGGHVGFMNLNWKNEWYSEQRAVEFVNQCCIES